MTGLLALLTLLALVFATPGSAALSPADLGEIGVHPQPGARVPAGLVFIDDEGQKVALGQIMRDRPTLLLLADFQCRLLCGPMVAASARAAHDAGLVPGVEFNFVVIGLGASEPIYAGRMKDAQLGDVQGFATQAHFLSGDAATFAKLGASIGFTARADLLNAVVAHPTDMLVLGADGRVNSVLPALGVDGGRLRYALVKARNGVLGALVDRAHVLCYGFDPARGIYNAAIHDGMLVAAGATLLGMIGAAVLGHRRRQRMMGAP